MPYKDKKRQREYKARWNREKYRSDTQHREKAKAYARAYNASIDRSKSTIGRWRTYAGNAKRRGLVWEIYFQHFAKLLSMPCKYCGTVNNVGVDRVDNAIGYTIDNSVSCCSLCNYMKSDTSKDLFLAQCRRIVDYAD